MKPLYTQQQFENAKTVDKLPCKCYVCEQMFYKTKRDIKIALTSNRHNGKFCSKTCEIKSKSNPVNVTCTNCGLSFDKTLFQISKSKSGNHFCSHSCSTSYNNKHKKHGNRRSKLEIWLQKQLTILYPNLEIHYNKTSAINSELDIYIPSLNLAFELNGIFHYEPIYGIDKLQKIQENDVSKSKSCHDAKIDLCIIDTSKQNYFKESSSKNYLYIIDTIIKERL